MTQYPFFHMLPFRVNDPTLPVIPFEDIDIPFQHEFGAIEHWMFGGSAASLTGLLSGKVLTAGGDTPAYSENYLTVSQALGNGLVSDIPEYTTMEMTVCAVVRRHAISSGIWIPFGTLSSSPSPADGGAVFVNGGGNLLLTMRGTTFASTDTGKSWPINEWVFLALSMSFAPGANAVKFLRGGQTVYEDSSIGTYTVNADGPLALGGHYYPVSLASDIDFAEFFVLPEALSAAELSAIYERRKSIMAIRGISIV